MTPPAAPKNQTPFDDEISLLDIIQFFKTNFKKILFFIILGGVLGYLYGKLASVYEGSVLMSPAKVSGRVIIEPKVILTTLNMNTFYSKETFLACNPTYYKDKDIDYDMSDIIKISITQDGNLIELKMQSSNKEKIHACFESIESDINASQKIIADPLIESKKAELSLAEKKLELAEKFRAQLNEKQNKNLKTNEQLFSIVFYANIALNNSYEIKTLLDQINNIRSELSSARTNDAGKILPINIQRKSVPFKELGLFLGGILGLFVSAFSIFIKKIELN